MKNSNISAMKSMTCRQLGGACDKTFTAETFEEIAELSKQHGLQMYEEREPEHLKAIKYMREHVSQPHEIEAWFALKRAQFDSLPSVES